MNLNEVLEIQKEAGPQVKAHSAAAVSMSQNVEWRTQLK